MTSLTTRRVRVAWAVLVGLTLGSWGLSFTRNYPGDGLTWVALVIFGFSVFKIRLVGLHFMELEKAPLPLRGAFEAFCMVLFAVLTGFYLAG